MGTKLNIEEAHGTIEIKRGISIKKESVYGTPIGNSDINKAIEVEGLMPFHPKAEVYDNKLLIGKGHEWITRQKLLRWLGTDFPEIVFQSNQLTDAFYLAMGLGGYSVGDVEEGVFLHKITVSDLATGGRVPRSTTSIQSLIPGEDYKIYGEIVEGITVTFDRKELVKTAVRLRNSGKIEKITGYYYPTLSPLYFFPAANTNFKMAPVGDPLRNVNEVISEVVFNFNDEFGDTIPYYPGGPTQSGAEGQVAGKQLIKSRNAGITVRLYDTEEYWRKKYRANKPFALVIECRTDEKIGATEKYYEMDLLFNSLAPTNLTHDAIDDFSGVTLEFEPAPFSSATQASMLEILIQNDVEEYLLAAS